MDGPFYTGRFAPELIWPVLMAATPFPSGNFEQEDPHTGKIRSVRRAVAIVARLDWLDTRTQMNLQHVADLSPSELKKRFHAIAVAADELLKKLSADGGGDANAMQRQIFGTLRGIAERRGEATNGFPNHPVTLSRFQGAEYPDYHGEYQLRDNVAAVAQLGSWAREAEKAAASRVGKQGEGERDLDLPYIEPWTDDAVTDALDGILRIWTDVLEREVKTSVTPDGHASGPLLRFVRTCLATLNLDQGSDGKPLTADAIRARIRRLPDWSQRVTEKL